MYSPDNSRPSQLASSALRAIGGFFNAAADFCDKGFRATASSIPFDKEISEVLSFREVITWITEHRPIGSKETKVAMLKEPHGSLTTVTIVFLDDQHKPIVSENGVPHGRAVRACELDLELTEYFGKHSMVLFE